MPIYMFQFIHNQESTSTSVSAIRSSNSQHYLLGLSLSQWIFTKLMDVVTAHLHQHAISPFLYLDSWLLRDLICSRLISHTILSPNGAKSRINSKSKKVRNETSSAIHLYRYGIPDTTQFSQSTTRLYGIPTKSNNF